jgi:hypothetical protein
MARPGLDKNVKFRALCRLLGEPRPHVRGYLEYLWETVYETGNAVVGDSAMVEAAAEFPGKPGTLCRALLSCGGDGRSGFIEPAPGIQGQYQVHDLRDHAPDYVQLRAAKEAERRKERRCEFCAREFRSTETHAKFCSPGCRQAKHRGKEPDLERSVTERCVTVTQCNEPPAPAPAPKDLGDESPKNPSCPEPDKPASEPKETRAREDVAAGPAAVASGGTSDPDSTHDDCSVVVVSESLFPDASARLAAADPVLLVFSTVGNGPAEWALKESKIREYRETFPALDVLAECRRALQWLRDNPRNRKTAKGMPRYLGGWLSRAQNRARPLSAQGAATGNNRVRTEMAHAGAAFLERGDDEAE